MLQHSYRICAQASYGRLRFVAGLGRIVYATSTTQLTQWMRELGRPPMGIAPLPITAVIPDAEVAGPVLQLADALRVLHARAAG